jgi:predicted acylesterase/phospholipase RssA
MRSLILAGGGMKIGYQAGVMQVLLDEAGLQFDHVDATSGGCFNLVMLNSGLSGTQIADNWRRTSPFDAMWPQAPWRYLMPWRLPSLMTYKRFGAHLLPKWGVDFDTVHASPIEGTYNVFNFSEKRPEILTQREITRDMLFACVALPMFFPAVKENGKTYFDGVYYKDSNITEAIRRGADEIWVVWTVNETPEYKGGFYRQYFHIIEAIADARFHDECADVARINDAVRAGTDTRHRHIKLHVIRHPSPVPMDYLIYFRAKQMSEIVDMGIADARAYLAEAGIPESVPPGPRPVTPVGLEFTEEMHGYWSAGASDPDEGARQGREAGSKIGVHLKILADDVDRFIDEAAHAAQVSGWVDCPQLGGQFPVEGGEFNLFIVDEQTKTRRMHYRLPFSLADGRRLALEGDKDVADDPGLDLWHDTTTLFFHVRNDGAADAPAGVGGAGVLHLRLQDLARQMTTFRVHGAKDRYVEAKTLARFGRFFFGELWDAYVQPLLARGRGG